MSTFDITQSEEVNKIIYRLLTYFLINIIVMVLVEIDAFCWFVVSVAYFISSVAWC